MSVSAASPDPASGAAQVIPTERPRRWIEPWYIAYAILGALASGAAAILLPLVVSTNGGSATQIGTAIAAQNVGALFAPLWGWISDRSKSYRKVFFGGFLLLAAGFLLLYWVSGAVVWIIGAFLIGFGTGASNTVASLFVVEFTPEDEWGHRISWLQTFNAIGSVLGVAGAGLISVRLGLLTSAALVLPAMAIGGWGLPVPRSPFHRPSWNTTRAQLARVARRVEHPTSSVIFHLHRFHLSDFKLLGKAARTAFGLFVIGWFVFSLAVSAFCSLYPVLMLKGFGIQVVHSTFLLAIATALSIPLYNVAGRLLTARTPSFLVGVGIGVRAIALAGLGALGFFHLPFPPLVAVIVLFGSFQGIWPFISVGANDLAAALAPFGEGSALGLFNAAAAVASASGAIIGGMMADEFGYPSTCLFAAAGCMASFFILAKLRSTR
jgi:MFS family permease